MSGFQNIGRIPELKRRIIMTFALLFVYRIGIHIPSIRQHPLHLAHSLGQLLQDPLQFVGFIGTRQDVRAQNQLAAVVEQIVLGGRCLEGL